MKALIVVLVLWFLLPRYDSSTTTPLRFYPMGPCYTENFEKCERGSLLDEEVRPTIEIESPDWIDFMMKGRVLT